MQTILLSGVSGFLGSNLAEALHKNYKIIGLKRSTSNCHRLQNLTIKTYNIDKIKLDSIFDKHKIDIIIHTATCYGRRGEPLSHLVETNLVFSLKLLELARKFSTKAFINADTLQLDSVSNYTISKRTLRDYLHNFSDINLINCRIEHIYGNDKDNSKFSTYLLNAFSDDVPCIPLTSGRQRRDFIYIDDVIRAFELILRSAMERRNERSYDIGSGEFISVRSFAECLLSEFRKHKACKTRLDFGAIPYTNLGEIKENLAPLRALGFMAKYSYQSGIRALIEAYLQNHGDKNHDAKVCTAKNSAVKNHTAKTPNAKNRKWGGAESSNTLQSRHYERSEVIHKNTESSDKKDLLYGLPRLEAIAESRNDDSTALSLRSEVSMQSTEPHLQIHAPLTVFARLCKKPKQSRKSHKTQKDSAESSDFIVLDYHKNPANFLAMTKKKWIATRLKPLAMTILLYRHYERSEVFVQSAEPHLQIHAHLTVIARLCKKPKQSITFNPCETQKDSAESSNFIVLDCHENPADFLAMTPSVAFGLPPMTSERRFHAKIAESCDDKPNSDSTAIFTLKLHKSHTLKAVA